jgi:hypothetical protein
MHAMHGNSASVQDFNIVEDCLIEDFLISAEAVELGKRITTPEVQQRPFSANVQHVYDTICQGLNQHCFTWLSERLGDITQLDTCQIRVSERPNYNVKKDPIGKKAKPGFPILEISLCSEDCCSVLQLSTAEKGDFYEWVYKAGTLLAVSPSACDMTYHIKPKSGATFTEGRTRHVTLKFFVAADGPTPKRRRVQESASSNDPPAPAPANTDPPAGNNEAPVLSTPKLLLPSTSLLPMSLIMRLFHRVLLFPP